VDDGADDVEAVGELTVATPRAAVRLWQAVASMAMSAAATTTAERRGRTRRDVARARGLSVGFWVASTMGS
jgi:hypothetical protein